MYSYVKRFARVPKRRKRKVVKDAHDEFTFLYISNELNLNDLNDSKNR